MRVIGLIAVLATIAACASPQQACVRAAQAELVELDRQIAESEGALRRGYRQIPATEPRTTLRICAWPREPVLFCTEHTPGTRAQREIVNVPAEEARLASLRSQRVGLSQRTAQAVAACRVS